MTPTSVSASHGSQEKSDSSPSLAGGKRPTVDEGTATAAGRTRPNPNRGAADGPEPARPAEEEDDDARRGDEGERREGGIAVAVHVPADGGPPPAAPRGRRPPRWTHDEGERLRAAVRLLRPDVDLAPRVRPEQIRGVDWTAVSERLLPRGGKGPRSWARHHASTPDECMRRYALLRGATARGGTTERGAAWTAEEDRAVEERVRACGPRRWGRWGRIAAGLPGRSARQCRERWVNHLDPAVSRAPWSEEEDRIILLSRIDGVGWSGVAKRLPGRTDNAIKNRWNGSKLRVEKHLYGMNIDGVHRLRDAKTGRLLIGNDVEGCLKAVRSATTRGSEKGKNIDSFLQGRCKREVSAKEEEKAPRKRAAGTSIVDSTSGNEDGIPSLQRLEERAAQIEASCRSLASHISATSDWATPHLIRRYGSLMEERRQVRERISLLRSPQKLAGDNNDDAGSLMEERRQVRERISLLRSPQKLAGDNNDDAQVKEEVEFFL